jgi:hypothetical protein
MAVHYPLHFTLEDGVHVQVNPKGDHIYEFQMQAEDGSVRRFDLDNTLASDVLEQSFDFDQLNAVRRFWLEQETH